MAAQTWAEWLSGLVAGLWPHPPLQPGSHEAHLEEKRLSALLDKELRKPAGQRDEELVHTLRVERRKLGLENAKAAGRRYKHLAWSWDGTTRQCCGAAQWVTQRIAASYRALADFYEQVTQQKVEDLATAEARRLPVIAVQPTVRLELPEALQQAPLRLDMCSECAQYVQQMELAEERCRGIADNWGDTFRRRAEIARSAPGGAAASPGAPDVAAAAPAVAAPAPPAPPPPAGLAEHGQRPPVQQQQQQRQQQWQQQRQRWQNHDCGGSSGGDADGSPPTPKQQQRLQQQRLQQQQQQQQQPQLPPHSSSDEEQR